MATKQKEEKMSEFKMTTIEEMEAATNRLLETGAKVGATHGSSV